MLSTPPPKLSVEEPAESIVDTQLLHLALIANKLSGSLIALLEGSRELDEERERTMLYTFALLVPVLTSLSAVMEQFGGLAAEGTAAEELPLPIAAQASSAMEQCLSLLQTLFTAALRDQRGKVAQTAVSSMLNVLQNPAAVVLSSVLLPCLAEALGAQPPQPAAATEGAWGAITIAMIAQQQCGEESGEVVRATIQLVLRLAVALANFARSAEAGPSAASTLAPAAQCLLQVARIDQTGLKAEVAALSADGQLTIQQLLRDHMSSTGVSGDGAAQASGAKPATLTAKKIELKMKF